jgi:hypothetical protein
MDMLFPFQNSESPQSGIPSSSNSPQISFYKPFFGQSNHFAMGGPAPSAPARGQKDKILLLSTGFGRWNTIEKDV